MPERDVRVSIAIDSDVSRAVLAANEYCDKAGLTTNQRTRIATVVSELARNILKYAVRGEIWVRAVEKRSRHGVQVLAKDRGPGIADPERAMADHFSTSGTLGLGLPGVRRMMDEFEIDSEPGKGARVSAVLWSGP